MPIDYEPPTNSRERILAIDYIAKTPEGRNSTIFSLRLLTLLAAH